MQITTQQNGGDRLSRRRFQVANGHYENAAYNDGGVPSYIVMLAMPDHNELSYCSKKERLAYLDQYNGQEAIILGFASSEEAAFAKFPSTARWWEHLQERAVSFAEIHGLDPKYTIIDIFENNYQVTLFGEKQQ